MVSGGEIDEGTSAEGDDAGCGLCEFLGGYDGQSISVVEREKGEKGADADVGVCGCGCGRMSVLGG